VSDWFDLPTLQPWRLRRCVGLKLPLIFTGLHGVYYSYLLLWERRIRHNWIRSCEFCVIWIELKKDTFTWLELNSLAERSTRFNWAKRNASCGSCCSTIYYNGLVLSGSGCCVYYVPQARSANFVWNRSASCSGGIQAMDAILLVRLPAASKMLWKTGNCWGKYRKESWLKK
jgi:hypothetical protein